MKAHSIAKKTLLATSVALYRGASKFWQHYSAIQWYISGLGVYVQRLMLSDRRLLLLELSFLLFIVSSSLNNNLFAPQPSGVSRNWPWEYCHRALMQPKLYIRVIRVTKLPPVASIERRDTLWSHISDTCVQSTEGPWKGIGILSYGCKATIYRGHGYFFVCSNWCIIYTMLHAASFIVCKQPALAILMQPPGACRT